MSDTMKVIAVSTSILLIVYLTCSLPIILKYSDGLQATDTKRNYLLVATLVPLSMAIIGLFVIFLTCILLEEHCGTTCICTIVIELIVILIISIPVEVVFRKRFEAIPNSCATTDECQSQCTRINKELHQELHAPFYNNSDYTWLSCGSCSCTCPEYSDKNCTLVEHPHFGMSSYSKIAGSLISIVLSLVISILISMFIILPLVGLMYFCIESESDNFSDTCFPIGMYIGFATSLLLTCSLPITLGDRCSRCSVLAEITKSCV